MNKNFQLDKLRYCLLPARRPIRQHLNLHNESFLLWRKVWGEVFDGLKFDPSHLEDDFLRQDIVAIICYENTPIAIHLYTAMSVESVAARSHSYLKQYPAEFFSQLEARKVTNIMTLEYMTVHPEWRKGKIPVHIGSVLVGLAFQVMDLLNVDASIAPARRDHKVHEIAYAFGAEPILENITNHNVPCDLLACFPSKRHAHADRNIQNLINFLWEKRENFVTQEEIQKYPSISIAA